jgi:hypothetical protein
MDTANRDWLLKLSEEATEKHEQFRGFVCHKEDLPPLSEWARNWRKEHVEGVYYACRVKAKMHQESVSNVVNGLSGSMMLALPAVIFHEGSDEITVIGSAKELKGHKVAMHQEPMVKISGKCQGDKSCSIKVTATEGTSKDSSIGGLSEAIESVLRELDQRKVKPASPLTFAVGPTTLTKYELENVLVEADDLIASHNAQTFEPNPDYPSELQPRLRGRQANRSQVQQIAKNLDADVLLTDYHSIDRGAPIIGVSDNVVESGNGRTMAIKLAISDYPESYTLYRAELIARAASLGLSEQQAKSMTHPVVVRRRLTDVPRRQFAEEANASTTLAPSAIEIARADASHITPQMVSQLWVGEDQGIEDALRSISNGEFVAAFLATVAANERAQITDARGQLNQDGIRRMVMALFVNAFPGDSGLRLAEKFFESTEPTVRNVFNGIAQALGRLAKSEALCRSGDRDPQLAIGEDLASAVVAFADIKKTPGMTVPNYINQAQMFERHLNTFQEILLRLIDERSKSGKKIGQILKSYAAIVTESAPPSQGSLIPTPRMTKDMALDAAVRRAATEESSAKLFQQPKLVTHCNALTVANKELGRIIKTLANTRSSLTRAQDKLGPSLNICGGQSTLFQDKRRPPKITISGKCGESVDTCSFTLKREGDKVKAKNVDEVLGALDKLSKKCTCRQETNMEQTANMELCPACLLALASDGKGRHRPGPWHVNTIGQGYAVFDSKTHQVADVLGFGKDDEEAKANAALIASAPKLLDELEEAVLIISKRDKEFGELTTDIRLMKEVIAQAKGHAHMHSSIKHICTPSQAEKREDCIMDMKERNRETGCKVEGTGSKKCPNVFAICNTAISCRPGKARRRG